jgi:DNA-binding MarR family transcriptional regulator
MNGEQVGFQEAVLQACYKVLSQHAIAETTVHKLLDAGFLQRRSGFADRAVHVELTVPKVALGQVLH